MNNPNTYHAGLYCRLSKDDDQKGESSSISTQKAILASFCQEQGFEIYVYYVDDGFSGLNFDRPAFQHLLQEITVGNINMVITKDLSRLGRDYIRTGYYSEIFFPAQGVRYNALADNFDSENAENDIAPFKNILNEMYARDISRKIKAAKHQRAKDGKFIGSQAPYGYSVKDYKLIVDALSAEVVQLIYDLACSGIGEKEICKQLERRNIVTPGEYKMQHGDLRFALYCNENSPFADLCP